MSSTPFSNIITAMGPMIPKEMKYNLHYGDVRGDVLPPPNDTNTSLIFSRNCSLFLFRIEAKPLVIWKWPYLLKPRDEMIKMLLDFTSEKWNTLFALISLLLCRITPPGTQDITKTCLYNFDPRKPHFYIVKLGFTGVYIIYLISAQKHRLWVLVRTASPRRF